jgi:hypothetical protein
MLQRSPLPVPFPDDEYPENWPRPEPGQTFADVVGAVPRLEATYARVARERVERLNERVPGCLDEDDRSHATSVLEELCTLYPGQSVVELLWILAADAFRPSRGGRPATWSGGIDGENLFELVEAGLLSMGLKRGSKKGVLAVVATIRAKDPARYERFSDERLRKAYYDARRARAVRKRC